LTRTKATQQRLGTTQERAKSLSSPKGGPALLIDPSVRTVAELLSEHTNQAMRTAQLGPEEWMRRILLVLNDLGYTEHFSDREGNLSVVPTQKLLAEVGPLTSEHHGRCRPPGVSDL
jgi:hypothetical protein